MSYINGINAANQLRLTGMTTGMDTDATVKQMTAAIQARIDKENQGKQIYAWQQEMYRSIIKDSRDFYDKYFEIGSSNSIFSSKNYSTAAVSSTKSSEVDATALPGAITGTYKVEVAQKAENSKIVGSGLNVGQAITATEISPVNWDAKSIVINGKPITFGNVDYKSVTSIRDFLNTEISNNTDLNGKVRAVVVNDGTNDYIRFDALTDTEVKIDSTTLDVFKNLGGRVINPSKSTTLENLGMTDAASLTFKLKYTNANGDLKTSKEITLLKTDTLQQAMDKINGTKSDEAIDSSQSYLSKDIEMAFSELTKSFTMNTRNTGENQSLQIMDIDFKDGSGTPIVGVPAQSKYLKDLFGISGDAGYDTGTGVIGSTACDAIVKITPPGGSAVDIVKHSNDFTIDGISYSIKDKTTSAVDLNVTSSVDGAYDKIKAFIEDYNKILDNIYTKVEEKKQYTYKPLTDEQKESMTDDQIETWETKAKQGLLKNDTQLQNMVTTLRSSFFQTVKGMGINITDIGLNTSADTTKRGKIEIDEAKLKEALKTRGDQVQSILTNTVPDYSTSILDETTGNFNKDNWEGKTITFKVGSVEKAITITGGGVELTGDNLEDKINAIINGDSDLKGKLSVSVDSGFTNKIYFTALTQDTVTIKDTTLGTKDAADLIGMEILNKNANSGVFTRMKEIFRTNVKMYDASLLKKAGYTGTASDYSNTLTKAILKKEEKITELNKKLYSKQDYYYKMFANLETYMNQMNAQMASFTQQFGS